jgi:hypothetical protein
MFRRCKGRQDYLGDRNHFCDIAVLAAPQSFRRWSSARPAFPSNRASNRCSRRNPMGWLFMSRGGMSPFATPKAYLDNQCTYPPDPDKGRETGPAGAQIDGPFGAYYAACQSYDAEGPKETFAIICLVKWNPGARSGEEFGYKDMSETMGPYHYDCPASILDLLGPPGNEYAANWREACRARSR